MTQRIKKISRIAQLLDHQKEMIEFQFRQIQERVNHEKAHLAYLENELQDTIFSFEKGLMNRRKNQIQEVDSLYDEYAYLEAKIDRKTKQVDTLVQELEVQKAVLGEAFKKKKAFTIFKDKMVFQEKREEELWEQKSTDYWSLVNRLKR